MKCLVLFWGKFVLFTMPSAMRNRLRVKKRFEKKPDGKIIFMICLLTCICIGRHAYTQAAAKQKRIDSLQKVLLTASSDTDKIDILLRLTTNLDCKDSLQKLSYARQALALSEKTNWSQGLFRSYRYMGDIYQNCINNTELAINAYNKLEDIARQKNDTLLHLAAFNELTIIYKAIGNYGQALDYSNKIIKLQVDNETAMGTWANMGEIYNSLGNFQKALESYERSLKMLNDILVTNKGNHEGYLYMQIGLFLTTADLYTEIGDYDKALKKYEAALNGGKQFKDAFVECCAYKGLGQYYLIKKEFARCITCYEKALEMAKMCDKDKVKGYEEAILNEIADGYLQMGNTEKALSSAQQSMSVAKKSDNKPQLAKTYTTLGKIYNAIKNYTIAIKYLQDAIAIAKETGAKDDEKSAWEALSISYTAMRQTDKAFAAYKNYIALRDSVYSAEKAKELTRMDMQGDFDRKQAADSVKQAEEKKLVDLRIQKQRVFIYSGFGGAVLMVLLAFFAYRNYSNEKKANVVISKANETIKEEKQVSENLLLNILPYHVAEELKAHGDVQAKQFDNVTILFTDFVGFTTAAERLSPQELVAELHACFKAFDAIISKYHIEKIKTVGDAYLAASGLPEADEEHAIHMVNAAIEIRDFMVERKKQMGDRTFGVRLGINSGSVVAGIVGVTKFAYDIWGDSVNTAARMEQNSEESRINISENTYALVKDKFVCFYRGELEAKNKGKLKMYFLDGKLI